MQVYCGKLLREQNDLAGVHREVFGYMKNRRQGRRHRSLSPKLIEQPCAVKIFQCSVDVANGAFKMREQFVTRNLAPFGELGVALPVIRFAAQPGCDPLPRIARDVQDEIANTV